ncbi:MAG: hypothetical protein Q7S73_02050 [bacterium]|nr:hypothetical protein [bacterium]
MPDPNDWLIKLPYDFSDKSRDECEADGWERIEIYDIQVLNDRTLLKAAIGSLNPRDRVALIKRYKNDLLGIFVNVWDVFEQGEVFIQWYKDPDTQNPFGVAIKINGKGWFVKDPGDIIDIDFDGEPVPGKIAAKINAMRFSIIQRSSGIYRIKNFVEVVRDES